MEATLQTLMSKIKILNETLWEGRATRPRINAWLDNFAPSNGSAPDERLHALLLLSNFMYFGSRQIRELLRSLYRDAYRYPLVEQIRRAHNDTLDSGVIQPLFERVLLQTRFLGVGNPSESGCHLLYYYRQENALPKDLFIHTHEIFSRQGPGAPSVLRDPTVSHYVFIDDFCGSGKQGEDYSRDLVEEIKRLNQRATVHYHVLFGTRRGLDRIRGGTAFDSAKAVYELDDSFRCFGPQSRCFKHQLEGIDKLFCESMARRYGESLVPALHALGYDDSQLLIGFHHNTPDNTLPIIWFDEPAPVAWTPVFRRYPKLEIW